MKFKFNVSLSDEDYLEYNKFHMLRSPYGAKQLKMSRVTITVLIGAFILISLLLGGFTLGAFIGTIPLFILLVVFQLCLTRFLAFSLKGQIQQLKKNGKMAYSQSSVMEFYEDSFIETTEENKMEQRYSSIERISIVDGKAVYIHVNNIMAYILPFDCFGSKDQYDSFLEFMKTKCTTIDVYSSKK